MASGGVFLTYNKVLPGTYINFVSAQRVLGTLGERGIVALPWSGNWGAEGEVIEVSADDFQTNALSIFGYPYTNEKLIKIREVFRGAKSIKFYRITSGEKAQKSIGNLNVIAKYSGSRGNDIRIVIQNNIDNESLFEVKTYIDSTLIDYQSVQNAAELLNNDFVDFKVLEGNFQTTSGIKLEGGSDTPSDGQSYSNFISSIEKVDFTTLLYEGEDNTTKSLFASFIKRLRNDEGFKATAVLYDYCADFEGVISVKNSPELVYWVAGKTAGANINQSLTNSLYDGEYSINTDFKNSELKNNISKGHFIFYGDRGNTRVLKDINTFISFTVNQNSDFSYNQVIRVIDSIANDTAKIFNEYYLGKVQNDEIGRDAFRTELVQYHNTLQGLRAITDFESTDIEITQGTEKGDVIVNEYVKPVCAMDKLYMSCIIE